MRHQYVIIFSLFLSLSYSSHTDFQCIWIKLRHFPSQLIRIKWEESFHSYFTMNQVTKMPNLQIFRQINFNWIKINSSFFFSVNFSKYFLRNVSIYDIPCAPAGRYDVLVSSKVNAQINVNVSQQKPFLAQKLLQYVQTSRIRYENRIHRNQTIFKWNKR